MDKYCIIKKRAMRISFRLIPTFLLITTCCIFCILTPVASGFGVKNTKHNLSVTGPGPAQATTEAGVCIFCHTPHNARPATPLWNHELSEVEDYINYWSPTLKSYASAAEAPPIDGFSKLCLSCHDGTVALGAFVNRDVTVETAPDYLTYGMEGYIGTDLSGGHPISIVFDSALVNLRNQDSKIMHLKWPVDDPHVKLYSTQKGKGIQCTTCHDPHGGRGETGAPPFWQKSTHDQVCLVCHDIITPIGH
jgi:predicted CXXCH cytochrome family protein